MKVTTKQIKKLIKEELKKVLFESLDPDGINIHNFTTIEDGSFDSIPLLYDGKLMEAYGSLEAAPVLYEYFKETLDESIIEKLIQLVDDDIKNLCFGESGRQAQELLKSLDPKFKGIPVGNLMFDDSEGYSYVQATIGMNGLEIVAGAEDVDEEGFLQISLGTFGYVPDFDYSSIMNPDGRYFDDYFKDLDAGSGGYGNQDVAGSVDVNINKIVDAVNSGTLGLAIDDERGEVRYVVKQRYD